MPYETFSASDGDFVLAVGNDEQWRRFCEVAGFDAGADVSFTVPLDELRSATMELAGRIAQFGVVDGEVAH